MASPTEIQPRSFLNPRSRANKFWNAYSETMPRAELDRLHLKHIQSLVEYAYHRSPMYNRLYKQAGVTPEDIKTMDDFTKRIPVVDKKDLLAAQAVNPPWGDALAVDPDYIAYRYQTSGTTGVPLLIPYTALDVMRMGEAWATSFWWIGMRPGDTFYFPFNWGTFIGFWAAYWGTLRVGGKVFSGGGLDTKGRIQQILQTHPQVIFATPTYALHMAEIAREMGVDLREAGVTWTYLSGEPGGCVPTTRRAVEVAWGSKAYELYGVAECGSVAAACPLQGGDHVWEDYIHSLVVNEAGEPVDDGQVGENIVTSFNQIAQPVIKYRTHDLVEVHRGTCDCGRTWTYFKGGVLGRTDHMIIIKGTNVYPTAVESLLGEVGGLSENYEVHVDRDQENDVMMVKVEAARDLPAARYQQTSVAAQRLLKEKIRVSIGVEVLPPTTLPRYELKARRFFDHRPEDKRWKIQRG